MPNLIIPLGGGLNLQEDPTQCPAGTLRDCLNIEVTQQAGYSVRAGWMPYDGTLQGTELQDFYYLYFVAGWNSISAIYGEKITLNLSGTGFDFICIGFSDLGSGTGVIVLANTIGGTNYQPVYNVLVSAASGAISGFALTAVAIHIQQASATSQDPFYPTAAALTCSGYELMLQNTIAQHQTALAVPGPSLDAPDACFLLADTTYALHGCIVFNFDTGTNASANLLEGHVIKSVGGAVTFGTVLNYVVTSGDWSTGNAAGYVIVYDVPLSNTFTISTGTQLNVYSADGVTALGNIFKYVAAGSLPIYATNTRSLIYKTTDQTTGYTSLFTGWARVPLTREIQYTQAYAGQATGIGFGPTGGAPYSIYEYTRNGLTNILTQLTPLTSTFWGCSNPTQFGGSGWTNITNIEVSDGVFATSPHNHNAGGNRPGTAILASTFALTDVPVGSAILGITVQLKWKTTSSATTIQDYEVCLQKPTTPASYTPPTPGKAQHVFGTTVNTVYTYGGPNDLWGNGWKLTDLQAPTFAVYAHFRNVSTTTDDTVNLDFIGVQVTYLPPSRIVYIRNALATSPTDVPAFIVHYTLDNNTQFTSSNGLGTLTIYSTGTEASFTAAGKTRVVGVGEQIRDAPAGAGNLLGWTASTDTPVTLPASGALNANASRWEWITYNFYADPNAQMAFGANGLEYAVGFDGTYLIRIRTGRVASLDNPRHIYGYASNLHLGYNSGDTIVTAPGRPLTVSGLQLSQVYNIGQPVVGYSTLAGQVLAVFGTRAVFGLQGTDPLNYTQVTLSPALGAFEYTVVNIEGEVLWTSFRGVETMQTTNAYGEFDTVPLSQDATPWLQPRLQGDSRIAIVNKRPVYALGVRNKRQYRLFFADGYTYTLTKFGPQGIIMGTVGQYYSAGTPVVARHVSQGIRSDGKELLYACWDVLGVPNNVSGRPQVARLDVGLFEGDSSRGVPAYFELNSVYPSDQNNQISIMTDCQFQYLTVFSAGFTGTATNIGWIDTYTIAGDDLPVNGQMLNGSIPSYPTTATSAKLTLQPDLQQLFLPLPVLPSSCSITAIGRMIKLRFDTSIDFEASPWRATKILVSYRVAGEQGAY